MFIFLDVNIFFIYSIIIALILSIILFLITFFLTIKLETIEKNSSYECGFLPFGDSWLKFEVKYYLIGILYIIFDLELIYMLPWIIYYFFLNWYGIIIFFVFFTLLTLGFIYEWIKGALQWN